MVAAVVNGNQLSLDPVVGGVVLGIIAFIMYTFREAQITRAELEMLLSAEKSTP
jgi:hypothetical protein